MPSKAFEARPADEARWKYLHCLLAGERCQCHGAPAGLQVFALVDAAVKRRLRELIPLINLSQTPPGFGDPPDPGRSVRPRGP